ncbi:MAG: 4-formylbenzenesulfonate dehydrogenase [Pseudomonadota bacterium]|jgi:NAD(P)-dependent dehydrogenase (short-subunit alcohol dehydrogenase family)
MGLNGQRIIVTGAASGFGAEIARHLAGLGARVVVADLNAGGAAAMALSLRESGAQALDCAVDVSQEIEVRHMVQVAVDAWGGLDVLVNNAGTTHKNKPALEVTEEEFDRVFRVNVKGLFWAARAALPVMVAQGSGCVVNVASTTGVRPGPGLTWYSATKAAMINATKGLALEMAPHGVRVNAVNPMIGETPMMTDFMGMEDTPVNRDRFLMRIPLRRFTRPQDVAQAVAFLASPDSSYLTGVCLDVDGGRNI